MSRKPLSRLTVYLPLKFRDLCISFLALFVRRERMIEVAHKLLKEKNLIGVLPDGNLLFYPLNDFKLLPIISEIYDKKTYDMNEIRTYKRIYDVGAHIGLYTLRISKQAPNCEIVAIEANPTNFKFLSRNISINGLENRVRRLNVAAGNKKGKVILHLSRLSGGDNSTKRWHDAGSAGHLTIDSLPLDSILKSEESCDLVKIDVEGAEAEVLAGLEKQYTKVSRIVVETHISIVNAEEIRDWLKNHHFEIIKTEKLYDDCLLFKAKRPCT
jgi:FkbM family methyltransferase